MSIAEQDGRGSSRLKKDDENLKWPNLATKFEEYAALSPNQRSYCNSRLGSNKSKQISQLQFKAVYCSGEDPEFPLEELNTHSSTTRGWQSAPFCSYPQELGFQFVSGMVTISQLQILSHEKKIAKKIEVYLGYGSSYDDCDFRRVGYIRLDDNEGNNFAARELKSVYVSRSCQFLKLLIHSCYNNQHNTYDQTGIVAVNVLGYVGGTADIEAAQIQATAKDKSVEKVINYGNKQNDIWYDDQTLTVIQELRYAKSQAIVNEDFDAAKRLKETEDAISTIGINITEFQEAKAAAVQREDYDAAASLKRKIDEKLAQIRNLAAAYMKQEDHLKYNDNTARISEDLKNHQNYRSPQPRKEKMHFDDHPKQVLQTLDTPIKSTPERLPRSYSVGKVDRYSENQYTSFLTQNENDDINESPMLSKLSPGFISPGLKDVVSNTVEAGAEAKARVPEEVIEKSLGCLPSWGSLPEAEELPAGVSNDTATLVSAFQDEYLVRCLYSKQAKLRSAAVKVLEKKFSSFNLAEVNIRLAFISVCRLACEDNITSIYLDGIKLLEMVIKAVPMDLSALHFFEPLLPRLMEKLGSITPRIRDNTMKLLLCFAHLPESSHGCQMVASQLLRPPKHGKPHLLHQLLGRLRLLLELATDFPLQKDYGLGLPQVMGFALSNQAFSHSHLEVRDTVKALVMQIFSQIGDEVLPYLRSLRPKQMEEYALGFEEIHATGRAKATRKNESTGSNSRGLLLSPSERQRHAEEGVLSPRLCSIPYLDEGFSPRSSPTISKASSGPDAQHEVTTPQNISVSSPDMSGNGQQVEEKDEVQCFFCDLRDPSFCDEDSMDLHYWKDCPMLVCCSQCSQVIEIGYLNDHLLLECENKNFHRRCPRCLEAVLSVDFDKHIVDAKCSRARNSFYRCALCHRDFESLKEHVLMQGCRNNRRTPHSILRST